MRIDKRFVGGFIAGFLIMLVVSISYVHGREILSEARNGNGGKDLVNQTGNTNDQKESQEILKKIGTINKIIDQYYLEEIDQERLVDGLYKGMVAGLGDPYSVYYNEKEFEELMASTSGTYSGIGVLVSQDPKTMLITVVRPFKDGPGYNAGMLPSDIIAKVNGEEISGQDIQTVVAKIKGERGTKVTVTVYREATSEFIDFDLVRDNVDIQSIEYEMLDEAIGYIEITEFNEKTYTKFMEAMKDLEKQGQRGLIIDLRNNPGGLLNIVADIANELLPEGKIVYTEDKSGIVDEILSDNKKQFRKPLVILINENSASASEILSGAVKDYGVGTLVGKTTYGKGVVQRIMDLFDGTAMKVTISKYFTPNGNDIHGVGVSPDIEVDLPDELKIKATLTKEEDVQLQKAIDVMKEKLQ